MNNYIILFCNRVTLVFETDRAMLLKQLLTYCILLNIVANNLCSQTNCKVILYDQVTHRPINQASCIIVKERNGKLLGYNRTNGYGRTNISLSSLDSLKLIVNHPKYVSFFMKGFTCKDTNFLYPQSKVIKEVIVKGTRAVTMNGDTVSYSADSFKVPAGSNVEDLLKRLPGIQVARDGTIKANGKQVQRVLVDGDNFFGNDATIATRNIEASMIDKVEVIDVESQRAQVTGETEAEKVKIINLKLKSDAKKGFFGKSKQGYSNTNRYESTNMINLFRDKVKASGYVLADNMNARLDWQDRQDLGMSQNWFYDEDLDSWINKDGNVEGGNTLGVIPNNFKSGAMISKQFDDATGAINAKYNYTNQKFNGDQTNTNTIIYDEGKRTTSSLNEINSVNQKSNVALSIEKRIDSFNKIMLTASAFVQNSEGENLTRQKISRDSSIINSSLRNSPFQSKAETYEADIDYNRKFKKKGRFFGLSGNLIFNQTDNSGSNSMSGKLYGTAGDSMVQNIDQFRSNFNKTNSIKFSTTYMEPIIKEYLVLEGSFSLLYNQNKSYNNTYNKNLINLEYSDLVAGLSNNYNYNVLALSQIVKLRYKDKKIETSMGLKIQETDLKQTNLDSSNLNLKRNFLYALPNYKFVWKYKRNSNLTFNFTTGITPPSITQIQPFVNNYNPQYIVKGNPNLIPAYSYRFSLQNSFWHPVSQSNLWSNISFRMIENDIVSSTIIDEKGNITQSFVQVNGNYNLNGNIYYSFMISPWKLNINPGANFSHSKTSQYTNGINNQALRNNGSISVSLSKTIDSFISSDLSLDLNYSKTNVSNSNFNNNEFLTYQLSTDHKITMPGKIKLIGELNWNYLPSGNSYGQNQSFLLLNAGLERSFLKKNSMIVSLYFYDILNQNRNVNRYFFNNQISETIQQALTRYGMLSLTYKFINKPKKTEHESDF